MELSEMQLAMNDAHGNSRNGWAAVESAPFFTGVSLEDSRRISAAARMKRFARGEMLFLEGDTVEQVLLLVSGSVKITKLGPTGMEVILRLGAPGDVLDAERLFSTGRHCTTAQAIRECWALVWDAAIFKALVEYLPALRQNMIQSTYGHLRELEERFRELATERVAPRVARQLIRLQEQVGSPGKGEVEIGLSREGLAQMTGTTLYTVSRLLSAWEAHGFVNSRRESVTVSDVRSLRKVFEDGS
jgi:CRP/FNR family transcriptional regulator, nitrogen oxide reductase regulator